MKGWMEKTYPCHTSDLTPSFLGLEITTHSCIGHILKSLSPSGSTNIMIDSKIWGIRTQNHSLRASSSTYAFHHNPNSHDDYFYWVDQVW